MPPFLLIMTAQVTLIMFYILINTGRRPPLNVNLVLRLEQTDRLG